MPNIIDADIRVSVELNKLTLFPHNTTIYSVELDEDGSPLVNCHVSYDYEPFESLSAPEFEFMADEVLVNNQLQYTHAIGVEYISSPGARFRPSRKKN